MDTTEHAEAKRAKRVRSHPQQLRAQVLAECELPGASVARVALQHGLNANLVHSWRRLQREKTHKCSADAQPAARGEFIALPMTPAARVADGQDIRIELRRGATTAQISWPAEAAGDCAAWLAQWLR